MRFHRQRVTSSLLVTTTDAITGSANSIPYEKILSNVSCLHSHSKMSRKRCGSDGKVVIELAPVSLEKLFVALPSKQINASPRTSNNRIR